jgi:hypothetical protein
MLFKSLRRLNLRPATARLARPMAAALRARAPTFAAQPLRCFSTANTNNTQIKPADSKKDEKKQQFSGIMGAFGVAAAIAAASGVALGNFFAC